MKEKDYINATNLAKVRAAKTIVRDLVPGDPGISEEEYSHVLRCLGAWEARFEREISPETKRTDKEPWRTEWPKRSA